jgi:hypothetical protein
MTQHMASPRAAFLFAGPSLFGTVAEELLPTCGLALLPPAVRGDINRLVRDYPGPGVIVLADGIFHSSLSVGHAELRTALEGGWVVWGVSSMGAIRACEMAHLGMKGFGEVFTRFIADEEYSDDEVALLHAPMEPYFPISEPLVHMRILVDQMAREDLISDVSANQVIDSLRKRWFGYRTLEELAGCLQNCGVHKSIVDERIGGIAQFRAKNLDLLHLLQSEFHERAS